MPDGIWEVRSVAQSCPALCDPMDYSTPGFPPITNYWSLLKLMSTESVVPFSHLILCRPVLSSRIQSFPASGSFQTSQFFTSGGQSIAVSASVSVIPMGMWEIEIVKYSQYLYIFLYLKLQNSSVFYVKINK